MRLPFWMGVATALVAFAHLLARRVEVAWLSDRVAREGGAAEEAVRWGT
jgi:hypothetical protein